MVIDPFDLCREKLNQFMPGYRVVVHDGTGELIRIVVLDARDDADAYRLAKEEAGLAAYELWRACAMIARSDTTL